jgi:hypothetical protein
VERLGRSADVRRFLLGVLLTTRFHLYSRPISIANEAFFRRLQASCNALLELLQQPGWERLGPREEEGTIRMEPIGPVQKRDEASQGFKRFFRHYFSSMNPPWSHLTPVPSLTLRDWPEPSQVLISVGPNIGIGDELIFFELARRVAHHFPRARLEVSSFNATLWKLCPVVAELHEPRNDQLWPYAHAAELLERSPDSLVVFVEFASSPIYRHLERVKKVPRFLYLDTGSRCARVVDQRRHQIAEHVESPEAGIYTLLGTLLDRVGLTRDKAPSASTGVRSSPRSTPQVFVNPFSSKDFKLLPSEWWAESLRRAAAGRPLEAVIFAGINEECRNYARAIANGCTPDVRPQLFGAHETPSIEATLRAAADSDLIFGLDTFTAHVGVIQPVPCVTVFFGSMWDPWRVKNNHVLNANIHDTPAVVAGLLASLLWPVSPEVRQIAGDIVAATRGFASHDGTLMDRLARALALQDQLIGAVERWAEAVPELSKVFVDTPTEFAVALREALGHAAREGRALDAGVGKLLDQGLKTWMDSNLFRYAVFLTSQPV